MVTVSSAMGALASLAEAGPSALCHGVVALLAYRLAILLRKSDAAQRAGHASGIAKAHPGTLSLLGLSLVSLCYSALAAWTSVDAGLRIVSGHFLRVDGALAMALTLAAAFAAMAALHAFLRDRLSWPPSAWRLVSAALLLLVVLCGPNLTVDGIDPQSPKYAKRSLAEVIRRPFEEELILGREMAPVDNQADRPIVCVAQRRYASLFFAAQTALANRTDTGEFVAPVAPQPERIARCAAESARAIASGKTLESALSASSLDGFFAHVATDRPFYVSHMIGADIESLPEPLKSQLSALLPASARHSYTAFDVALAARRPLDAAALLPESSSILPHQRQGLFALALAGKLRGVPANPANATGGFTEFDYFVANRSCDLRYAQALSTLGAQPSTVHILHLLSTIGHAQYPNLEGEFARVFPDADDTLGFPKEQQLHQCTALAQWYGVTVKDFNTGGSEARAANYLQIYQVAAAAVLQRRLRGFVTEAGPNRVSDATMHGDPAILVNAAALFLQAQPASYDQFCAWADTSLTWTDQLQDQPPGMTAAMASLPARWKGAATVYRTPGAGCQVAGIYGYTNPNKDPRGDAIRFMNAAMRKTDLPCQANPDRSNEMEHIVCQVSTTPWPSLETD